MNITASESMLSLASQIMHSYQLAAETSRALSAFSITDAEFSAFTRYSHFSSYGHGDWLSFNMLTKRFIFPIENVEGRKADDFKGL